MRYGAYFIRFWFSCISASLKQLHLISNMVKQEEIIIKGPELPCKLFEGSFSDFLFQKMKSHPQDNIFQINADTGEELTFREILKLSAEIGEGLVKNGLKKGDVVALAGKNSTQLHAASFGTLFSGGVFAAVEPEMKIFEMQLLYEQIRPKYVFCEHHVENDVATCLKNINSDAKIVVIDAPSNYQSKNLLFKDLIGQVDLQTYAPSAIESPAEEIALIVCSSGSSGIPKGVKITHRGMVHQLNCWEYNQIIDFSITFLQTSHFFWISGILFIYLSCVFGGKRIYIRSVNEKSILNAIHKYKPQYTMLPPPELLSILNYPHFRDYDVSSIKWILTGGSRLPQIVVDRLKEFSQHVQLIQGYGMTEMSGVITNFDLDGDIRSPGQLTFGASAKFVDISTGQTLGPNQVGEILFKSVGIMKGYIGNDEATKNAIDRDGWYHSGDLGYYNENHYIYLVDRIKEIIKFRNMQISPAEIEAFLESLPEIKEAGVVGIPNDEDTNHPMALIVKKKGYNITAEEIKERVKNNLSSYKELRAGVIFVDQLPRTSTGKIKRSELKELGKKLYQASKIKN